MITAHEILRLPRISMTSIGFSQSIIHLRLSDGFELRVTYGPAGEISGGTVQCDYDVSKHRFLRCAEISTERASALLNIHHRAVAPAMRAEASRLYRRVAWRLRNELNVRNIVGYATPAWRWADEANALRAGACRLLPPRSRLRPASVYLRTLPEAYQARARQFKDPAATMIDPSLQSLSNPDQQLAMWKAGRYRHYHYHLLRLAAARRSDLSDLSDR